MSLRSHCASPRGWLRSRCAPPRSWLLCPRSWQLLALRRRKGAGRQMAPSGAPSVKATLAPAVVIVAELVAARARTRIEPPWAGAPAPAEEASVVVLPRVGGVVEVVALLAQLRRPAVPSPRQGTAPEAQRVKQPSRHGGTPTPRPLGALILSCQRPAQVAAANGHVMQSCTQSCMSVRSRPPRVTAPSPTPS